MVHTIAHYSRLQGCNMVDCKIYPDTSTESLIEFVKAQSDCSGLILLVGADRMDAERLEALGSLPMTIVVVDSMYFMRTTCRTTFTSSPRRRQLRRKPLKSC